MARHLTMEERDRIAQLKHQGASQKEIARFVAAQSVDHLPRAATQRIGE